MVPLLTTTILEARPSSTSRSEAQRPSGEAGLARAASTGCRYVAAG